MDVNPFFPVMVDPVGALLPALIALAIVCARRARCGLCCGDRAWLVVLSLALTVALARLSITDEQVSLHLVPGATVLVCYLVWAGHAISPGFAFVLTYATSLPVDVLLARLLLGAEFDPACIGGGGWRDGLLTLPALTALAVMYANWRMDRVGRARLVWLGQWTGGAAWANRRGGAQARGRACRRETPRPSKPIARRAMAEGSGTEIS